VTDPVEAMALAALLFVAYQVGRLEGTRSSRSTLKASETILKAARAVSASTRSAKGLHQVGRRMLQEALRVRKGQDTLIDMVKQEVLIELNPRRRRRVEAQPQARSPMPGIARPLWTEPQESESLATPEASVGVPPLRARPS
jgi:hypothetical protein